MTPIRRSALLTVAHTAIDFYATMFPPLLRLFREHFGMTLTQVSSLPAIVTFCSAVLQPVFGMLSERFNRTLVAGISLIAAAICMSCIGFAQSPAQLLPLLICGSLGVAAFHPTGGAAIVSSAGARAYVVMSLFMTGGSLGLAISPAVSTWIVRSEADMPKLWFLMVPGLLLAALLLNASRHALPHESQIPAQSAPSGIRVFFEEGAGALWTLWTIAFLRSIVFYVLQNFMSIYGETRHWSLQTSGQALSLFLICGTVGSVVGGLSADRFGPRRILCLSTLLWCVFLQVFLATEGWASLFALAAAGFFSWLGAPVNVTLAQRMKPNAAGTVTGMMMGLAWGIAGLTLPAFGYLAEQSGVGFAISVAGYGLAIASGLVVFLPTSARMTEMGLRQIRQPIVATEK